MEIFETGPYLEGVRQVQLHLSILGNRCMHLSIFRHDTSFTVFSYDFPANCQICTCQFKSLSRALCVVGIIVLGKKSTLPSNNSGLSTNNASSSVFSFDVGQIFCKILFNEKDTRFIYIVDFVKDLFQRE